MNDSAGSAPSTNTPHWPVLNIRVALGVIAIALLLAVFVQVATFELSRLDDRFNITENPNLISPTGVRWHTLWTEPYGGLYVPVTYSFWAAEVRLSQWWTDKPAELGCHPAVFHLGNLLLHLACCVAVMRLLTLLDVPWTAALAGTLLFGLHPLQVESLAFVTETKGLLAALLGLLALLQFLRAATAPWRALLAAVLFVLALAAKPSAVVLVPWCLLWWWLVAGKPPTNSCSPAVVDRRWRPVVTRQLGWPQLVALALMTVAAGAAVWISLQAQVEAIAPEARVDWAHRPLVVADAAGFYLAKLIAPWSLAPDHGRSPAWILAEGRWLGGPVWLLPFAALVAWWHGRESLVCLVLFLVALLPNLGLLPFSHQAISTVADRYAYLALVAPAWWLGRWLSLGERWRWAAAGGGLCLLGAQSFIQAGYWHDDVRLFRHTLAVNPRSVIARVNLALALRDASRPEEAATLMEDALRLRAGNYEALFNLATIRLTQGRLPAAETLTGQLVALYPERGEPQFLLGDLRVAQRRHAQAKQAYLAGLERLPRAVLPANNLAWLLLTAPHAADRDPAAALRHAQNACRYSARPRVECLDTLAAALAALKDVAATETVAQQAIELARAEGQLAEAARIESRLEAWKRGEPYAEIETEP